MRVCTCSCARNKTVYTMHLITFAIFPQVTELSASLADERETASHASEMLEGETMERMRLERQMQELQVCSYVQSVYTRINSLFK